MDENELFTEKVQLGKVTYFFNVKNSKQGKKNLVIHRSEKKGDNFEHQRLIVFQDDVISFNDGLKKAILFILNN